MKKLKPVMAFDLRSPPPPLPSPAFSREIKQHGSGAGSGRLATALQTLAFPLARTAVVWLVFSIFPLFVGRPSCVRTPSLQQISGAHILHSAAASLTHKSCGTLRDPRSGRLRRPAAGKREFVWTRAVAAQNTRQGQPAALPGFFTYLSIVGVTRFASHRPFGQPLLSSRAGWLPVYVVLSFFFTSPARCA